MSNYSTLDVPKILYTNGSKFAGRVVANFGIKKVVIRFVGRTRTTLQKLSQNAEPPSTTHILLLEELRDKEVKEEVPVLFNPQSWEFDFAFPGPEKHPKLPSTFHGDGASSTYKIQREVSYVVEADLYYSNGRDTISKELVFSASGLKEIPDPEMVLRCQGTIVGKKILSMNKGSRPKASFMLNMSMPSVAVVGQDLPVSMNVKQNSGTSVPSTVYLKDIKVSLEETIVVESAHSKKSGWTNSRLLAFGIYSEDPISITEGKDICKMLKLRIRPELSPTFKTIFIRRDYMLTIKMAVECIGETSRVDFVQCLQLSAMDQAPGPLPPNTTVHDIYKTTRRRGGFK